MYTLDNTDGDFSVGGNVGQNRPFVRSGIPNVRIQPLGEVEVALDFGTGIIYQHVIVAETEEPLVLGNCFCFIMIAPLTSVVELLASEVRR